MHAVCSCSSCHGIPSTRTFVQPNPTPTVPRRPLHHPREPYLYLLPFASATPSESQGLLQAAAGSGFIGFSAFQTPASPSSTIAPTPGASNAGAGGGTARVRAGGGKGSGLGGGGKRGVKTAKVDGGYSPGAHGQVGAVCGRGVGVEVLTVAEVGFFLSDAAPHHCLL